MKILKCIVLIAFVLGMVSCNPKVKQPPSATVNVAFNEASLQFTGAQKEFVREVVVQAESDVRNLLPELPDSIQVEVEYVDWDLDVVDGVTGRTETNSPPLVLVQIGKNYREGVIDSIHSGLRATLFHEFHHLVRGWAIQDNTFSYGIPNAMVNEGLAVVFAEIHTGKVSEVNAYTEAADGWVKEILALPLDASYADWVMGEHPDGRTYIGYRTGNYLVRKAMALSGKNIIELSGLMPEEIIRLAGY